MTETSIKESLINTLSFNFGKHTADLYRNYCADKDDNTCFTIIQELLRETLGEKNTQEQLDPISKRLNN